MPDNDIVEIDTVITNAGPSRAGFGLSLVLSHNVPWDDELRLYEDSSDAVTDGFAEDSPEVLLLRQMFSQNPKPPLVAIGKASAAVIQQYTVGVQGAAKNTFAYKMLVSGEGFEETEVSYTSDANATAAEIHAGLIAALNAVVDKTFTAAPNANPALPFTVTANAASSWFSIAVLNSTALSNKQTHVVAGLDADLDAIKAVNDDWYVLLTLFNSTDYVGDAAAWCAANGKVYPFDVVDTDTINAAYVVGVTTDVGSVQLGLGRSGVAGAYHPKPSQFFVASWMGRWLPTTPGQSNPAWKPLEGVEATLLTTTQRTNLLARRMSYYRRAFGQSITWEGMVFSTVYRYIDIRRNADWLSNTMQTNIVAALAGAEIVGFDDPGIQVIAGAAEDALSEGTTQGVLVSTPKYTLQVPLAENISDQDKADRALRKIVWNAQIRSAINKVVPVKGTLTF